MNRPPRIGKTSSQRVDEMINRRDSPLGRLLKHAAELDHLDRQLSNLLDPQLSRNCQVADLCDGRLTLISTGAAWATRLRLQTADIVEKLNDACGVCINQIVIRIAPIPEAITALQRFAKDSGDPELQSIVHGLESHRDGE
jgi:hypothetical protein